MKRRAELLLAFCNFVEYLTKAFLENSLNLIGLSIFGKFLLETKNMNRVLEVSIDF